MSIIESINQAATASAQTRANESEKSGDIMGKEDFLTLLVAQLKNQDPLNPDDPTEFTAQLAQFSSLEQLFNLNESMDNVAASVSDSQKLSALNMIGKEVTYADGTFNFDGDPIQLGYSLDGNAREVTLSLQQNGRTYATLNGMELSKGNHYITWDGFSTDGTPAPPGEYTIVVQASAAEGESVAVAPLVRSEVTGVDLEEANGGLLFTKAGEVSVNKIKGVYDAAADLGEEESAHQEATTGEEAVTEIVTDIAEETVPTEG